MKTTIDVNGKTLELANNAFTPILYRQIFGRDFLRLFSQMLTKNNEVLGKAKAIRALKADFDSKKITNEEYLSQLKNLNLSDDDISSVSEQAELISEIAFVMNKQAELVQIDKLLKLSKIDYYSFLSKFNTNDLRSGDVISSVIKFWQNGTESNVDSKN